jgi:hypothetical protein
MMGVECVGISQHCDKVAGIWTGDFFYFFGAQLVSATSSWCITAGQNKPCDHDWTGAFQL